MPRPLHQAAVLGYRSPWSCSSWAAA